MRKAVRRGECPDGRARRGISGRSKNIFGIRPQDQKPALPYDFAGDLHGFGDEVQHLLIHWPSIGAHEQQMEGCALGGPNQ